VTIISNAYSLYDSEISVINGPYVLVTNDDVTRSGRGFQDSWFFFENVDLVDVQCNQYGDCVFMNLEARKVNNVSIECINYDIIDFHNCESSFFSIYDSSLDLNCVGNSSCQYLLIDYTEEKNYTSCLIDCQFNQNDTHFPSCINLTITVMNNALGYEAIDLFCQTEDIYQACNDIDVACEGTGGYCQCKLSYDSNTSSWACPGQCGTSMCKGKVWSDSTSNNNMVIVIAVLSFLICVALSAYVSKRLKKKNVNNIAQPETPLIN